MDLDPISRPQKGVRQYGVDLKAYGQDVEDGQNKVFLFLIKRGDLDRKTWDSGEQSVRASLNEVFDVYLPTMVEERWRNAPKKIIVCCNGKRSQTVEINWMQYDREHARPGEIEIDFWGADKLALLIEQHLMNELLFPPLVQKQLRKTLALLDVDEAEPRLFYQLADELLFGRVQTTKRERQKTLRLLTMCLNMLFHWCREMENLKPALLASERVLLRLWDWRRLESLLEDSEIGKEFSTINLTRVRINSEYFQKLRPFCYVPDGLFAWTVARLDSEVLEYPLRTFEQIGILANIGLDFHYISKLGNNEVDLSHFGESAQAVEEALVQLINNNPSSVNPPFDGHGTDICLALMLFFYLKRRDEAVGWLHRLFDRLFWAYRLRERFPILSDSYEELLVLELGVRSPGAESSSLLLILLEWCVVFEARELYERVAAHIKKVLPGIDLQLWYPDETTEDYLYKMNALGESGAVQHSIELPDKFDDFKQQVIEAREHVGLPEHLSFLEHPCLIVPLVASRHFRTPVFPFFWRHLIS